MKLLSDFFFFFWRQCESSAVKGRHLLYDKNVNVKTKVS